ncbi:MAG TPA: hypothetical protein PLV06_05260 [Bacteroidales bacterium]|nr:hypothetical protein [Bacteroidales bacterium]HPJ59732.1 hypothetical protein [Bacteroidales bacterium]HPR11772.1 hypothetical protein [Bacteroidales bacterium]HRW84079.1 hypothetical protein [Bacteroidales bacterium]
MKKIFTTAVLILIIGTAAFAKKAVAEGRTNSTFGDYKIQKADTRVTIEGVDCKTYKISYRDNPLELTVVVKREKGSRKFYVLSDKLSVQYKWNKDYFGIERLDKSLNELGYATSDENLNRQAYFHQKVLCPGLLLDRESARMIAAFYPMLLTPESLMLAGK